MVGLLSDLLREAAARHPGLPALEDGTRALSYAELAGEIEAAARGFLALGLGPGERVGVYLEKRWQGVVALYGAAWAGGVFVPINPGLKPRQVRHVLRDCNIRFLVTSAARRAALEEVIGACPDLEWIVLADGEAAAGASPGQLAWQDLGAAGRGGAGAAHRVIDQDMAAILYTSGSTGMPKGVVLSHRNLVMGAQSVSHYLAMTPDDRILSVLPLSFDAGLSQLTISAAAGASVVLLNYLLPRDVLKVMARERITGVTGVPPLWIQLARLDWPEAAKRHLRFMANTGGAMPRWTVERLRALAPDSDIFLMYGLTEAFRSTYLPPAEVDRRPDSIGKAIPNAEVLVVREDGSLCDAGEPGELVHRGALVALGYWNDPARTAERFRPAPRRPDALSLPETAVWSGDTVRRDAEGYLYFVGRRDEMIKTSGYRVSPTEVEEVAYASGLVGEAAALGLSHPDLGQGIVVVGTAPDGAALDGAALIAYCRRELPAFMVPLAVIERPALPKNANGKIDRRALAEALSGHFREEER